MTFSQLRAGIGTGAGTDWTLTWDEGLGTQTTTTIDFGSVLESDWLSLPTITNPPNGAPGVPPDTSIDWAWPASPVLGQVEAEVYVGTLADFLSGPINAACDSGELPSPPAPITWDPACLSPGTWTAVVINENEFLRAVPDGLSISGDTWNLENDEWLAADSLGMSEFDVVPEPSTASLLALGLVGLAAVRRRRG